MINKEDMKVRSRGIGSSEIAMLVTDNEGKPLCPWGGRHKLWRKKTGQEPEVESTDAQLRGIILEPALIKWYEKLTGNSVLETKTIQSEKHPIVIDSADGLVFEKGNDSPTKCLEVKTTHYSRRSDWGEPGTDDIPKHYLLQGIWHCGAHELPSCDFPAFWGDKLQIYTAKFDEDMFLGLVDLANRFWKDHIVGGKAPDPDGDKETSKWISANLEQKGKKIVEADDAMAEKLLMYRTARIKSKALEQDVRKMENEIKLLIGENYGMEISNTKQRVTFPEVKGRTVTDWKSITKDLGAPKDIIEKHTRIGNPYRRFIATGLMNNE